MTTCDRRRSVAEAKGAMGKLEPLEMLEISLCPHYECGDLPLDQQRRRLFTAKYAAIKAVCGDYSPQILKFGREFAIRTQELLCPREAKTTRLLQFPILKNLLNRPELFIIQALDVYAAGLEPADSSSQTKRIATFLRVDTWRLLQKSNLVISFFRRAL